MNWYGSGLMTPLRIPRAWLTVTVSFLAILTATLTASANPANKTALIKHYDRFLAKRLDTCATCHISGTTEKLPTSLSEFPHNPFGHRLRLLGEELRKTGKKADIPSRLTIVAREDSDRDGIENETEILLGCFPGDASSKPHSKELRDAATIRTRFAKFFSSYRWQPFETVRRPAVPTLARTSPAFSIRNPIDAFIAAEHRARKLKPRSEAPKHVLLRRLYLDLIGVSPTPEELRAFEDDKSPNAHEKVADRLLADPRYGERWGRHWMDVWRYSDWAGYGNQVRDSKPHIWRWRDWIIESLNKDKGYDRMVLEMLAADELNPEDPDTLRATGFLVRNYKLLSREKWLEDVVTHTGKAFLGITIECARCHDHMYDPITQKEYYQWRAIFETHNVRTDRIPGEANIDKDGLPRAYDAELNAPTYFFVRGDERNPDKNQNIVAGIPHILGGTLKVESVKLPLFAYVPDKQEFVIRETVGASEKSLAKARRLIEQAETSSGPVEPEDKEFAQLKLSLAEAEHVALLAVLRVEKLEDEGNKDTEEWKQAATEAVAAQRQQQVVGARHRLKTAQRNLAELRSKNPETDPKVKQAMEVTKDAEKALASFEEKVKSPLTTDYVRRIKTNYPATSTGRRLAFARWITRHDNPLTARVAMNQIWLRHFGQALLPTVTDFGRNGRPPSHPALLDWLAVEFMTRNWSMKAMHRLIVTSSTYRMASTDDGANAKIDPDNTYLWRMNSRRMEAELVRDNILYVTGSLEMKMGGPEIDHSQGLTSKRRSIYLRTAAEKEVEFLKVFDGPSVAECYERRPSVLPQQALALANSELTIRESKYLAKMLYEKFGIESAKFVNEAFLRILARRPSPEETRLCREFLSSQTGRLRIANPQPGFNAELRARENLLLVLFSHNDFVTVR